MRCSTYFLDEGRLKKGVDLIEHFAGVSVALHDKSETGKKDEWSDVANAYGSTVGILYCLHWFVLRFVLLELSFPSCLVKKSPPVRHYRCPKSHSPGINT